MLPNIPQFLAMAGYIEVPLALPQALVPPAVILLADLLGK